MGSHPFIYNQMRLFFFLEPNQLCTMRYLLLALCCIGGLAYGQTAADSIHYYTVELDNHTDEVDFNDRINLLYFLSDSIGDKRFYQVKVTGYCSKDNKLKKASSFAKERADAVKRTLLDNGFFEEQIISVDGKGGADVSDDRVWLTFFPRTMKEAQIKEFEAELERLARYVVVTDSLMPGDLVPGKIYIMEKITFLKGKASFDREALPYIANLGEVLAADTTLQVDVVAHVCCPDVNTPDAINVASKKRDLTQARARTLCGYLVKKAGVAPPRLKPVPKGPTEPRVAEVDEVTQQQNERIELVISKQ